MLNIKSHITSYSKQQRHGIFLLLLLIIILQLFTHFFDGEYFTFTTNDNQSNEIFDSIYNPKIQDVKVLKKQTFNPNFITDYKGYLLGMTPLEIDRLHNYRKQNKWINTVKEFKLVTKINDSLLQEISQSFKFPTRVKYQKNNRVKKIKSISKFKTKPSTNDLNLATIDDFKQIKGVNYKLAKTIVNYRSKLKGYSFKGQLNEVFLINNKAYQNITKKFKIIVKPSIIKLNINRAKFKEVLALPYIDYKLCKSIFNYRDQVVKIQYIEELRENLNIPSTKFNRIVLYLKVN